MGTINLQLVGGHFYPTDFLSKEALVDSMRVERIPEERFDMVSPRLVRDGYKLAVTGYSPAPSTARWAGSFGFEQANNPAPKYDPCKRCYLDSVCSKEICSRNYRR